MTGLPGMRVWLKFPNAGLSAAKLFPGQMGRAQDVGNPRLLQNTGRQAIPGFDPPKDSDVLGNASGDGEAGMDRHGQPSIISMKASTRPLIWETHSEV